MTRCDLRGLVLASASVSVICLSIDAASAQQSPAPAVSSRDLPPVVVATPQPRRASTASSKPTRRASTSGVARHSGRNPQADADANNPARNAPNAPVGRNPRGPIDGYVATRAMTGTKTDTPIMETPQAISVIGRGEIRDQNPGSFAAALRYAPGVRSETFGADTRNDWFKIRGFDAQDVGLFADGLQLFSTAFATWKFPTAAIERIDILRGPSAVLYGGSGPGGFVNIISKTPPFTQQNSVETGVNSFGNGYFTFDLGGPVPTAKGPSTELFYRLIGSVKGGDTQTDFTPDNNYFIAPSVTYKPDIDTKLTILASASRNQTRVQNFLPYVGTVVNAPFGRIPTSLFASDPRDDYFRRQQEMIGYQFERNLTDDLTFRQNARIAHDDVQFQTLLGNGYVGTPASAMLSRFNDFAHELFDAGQSRQLARISFCHRAGPAQGAGWRRPQELRYRRFTGV